MGGNDTLYGLSGNDSLIGDSGNGNDYIDGGAGADTMIGDLGDDTYVVDSYSDVMVENFNEGIDTVDTTLNAYTLLANSNLENLTFIGTGNFTGQGNELDNVITAGAGNDTLIGLA